MLWRIPYSTRSEHPIPPITILGCLPIRWHSLEIPERLELPNSCNSGYHTPVHFQTLQGWAFYGRKRHRRWKLKTKKRTKTPFSPNPSKHILIFKKTTKKKQKQLNKNTQLTIQTINAKKHRRRPTSFARWISSHPDDPIAGHDGGKRLRSRVAVAQTFRTRLCPSASWLLVSLYIWCFLRLWCIFLNNFYYF